MKKSLQSKRRIQQRNYNPWILAVGKSPQIRLTLKTKVSVEMLLNYNTSAAFSPTWYSACV